MECTLDNYEFLESADKVLGTELLMNIQQVWVE